MKRVIGILFALAAVAPGMDWDGSVTLDPNACAEAWQQVSGSLKQNMAGTPFSPSTSTQEAKRWQAVQQAAGTPLMPVLLLGWLQELNPLTSMTEHPTLYADVLELCAQAFAGQREACMQLAKALRSGVFENGLLMWRHAAAAQKTEASGAELCPP